MKYHLGTYTFNDKNFWKMFNPQSAVDHFVIGAEQFRQQGGHFIITDISHEEYIRDIDIWAEHPQESVITMLVMKQQNKYY